MVLTGAMTVIGNSAKPSHHHTASRVVDVEGTVYKPDYLVELFLQIS